MVDLREGQIVQAGMAGTGWTVSNIFSSLRELGLAPTAVEPEGPDTLRLIALYDPASTLKFGCLYEAGRGDAISMIGMLCILPAPHLSREDVMGIDQRLAMATAFLEDGQLWIYAELNISPTFTRALFETQVDFYVNDMRTALQMLMSGEAMTFKAADAMKQIARQRGMASPMVRALMNKGEDRPSRSRAQSPVAVMAAAQAPKRPATHCPKCKGSGRGLFRSCAECGGMGLVR